MIKLNFSMDKASASQSPFSITGKLLIDGTPDQVPYGQLPILHHNGTLMCQSLAIARFLASEYGLAGRDNLERAQVDEIIDAITDIRNGATKFIYAPEGEKEAAKASFITGIDVGFTRLEAR